MNIVIIKKDKLQKQGLMLSIDQKGIIEHYQMIGNIAVIVDKSLTMIQSCRLIRVIEAYLLLSGDEIKNIQVINHSGALFDLKSLTKSHW